MNPFTSVIFAAGILLCATSSAQIQEALFREIVMDPAYEKYAETKMAAGLAYLKYGIEAVQTFESLVEKQEKPVDVCNMPKTLLSAIDGGLELQKCECARINAWENLKNKYPQFSGFSKEDKTKIYSLFVETHPRELFIAEVAGMLRLKN